MNNRLVAFSVLFLTLLSPFWLHAQENKSLVHGVWEHLDPDADYFSVMRPQKAIDTLMELGPKLGGGMMAGFGPDPDEMVDQARKGIRGSGIEGLASMGMSHRRHTDHTEARLFLGRAPGAAGPLWEALPPRDNIMSGIRYMPASSAICSYGNLRPGKLLDAAKAFMPAEMAGELGGMVEEHPMSAYRQISALQGDWGAALTLHPSRTIPSPSGDGPPMPEPGFVLVAEGGQDFHDFLGAQLGETSPVTLGGASGLKAKSIPLPFPNDPHLFRTESRVVLASSAELASEVLGNLSGSGKGLLGNPEFRALATGFTGKSTFFSYVSPQAAGVLSRLQKDTGMDMDDMLGPAGSMLDIEPGSSGLSSVQSTQQGLAWRIRYKGTGAAVPIAGLAPLGVAMVLPAAGKMEEIMAGGVMNQMKSNGKNMYIATFADAIDASIVGFPTAEKFQTSSDFFKAQATGETKILAAKPSYVAGYKKPAADWNAFGAANNGWSVVAGFDETADAGTPFLISANLLNEEIEPGKTPAVNIDPNTPLGNNVVVATHGGGAIIINGDDPMFWAKINPADATIRKGQILRP